MSYILNALKKAEFERQREQLPDARHLLTPTQQSDEKRSRGSWGLLLVLGLNVAIIAYLVADKSGSSNEELSPLASLPPLPSQGATDISPAVPHKPKPQLQERPPEAPPRQETAVAPAVTATPEIAVQPIAAGPIAHLDTQSVAVKLAPFRPRPNELAPKKSAEQTKLPLTKELPKAIQDALPTLSLAALVYSDNPASRMVFVNSRLMHEKQRVSEELELTEIRPNEVVFQYQSSRFRVPMF